MFRKLLVSLLLVFCLCSVAFGSYVYDGMGSYEAYGSSGGVWIDICFWLVFGFLAAEMARNRGRSPLLGFILGVLGGIIALIGYWIAGDSKGREK